METPRALSRGIPRPAGGLARRLRGSIGSAIRLLQVRLRIPLILIVAGLVVGRWDVLRNYWDRLTTSAITESLDRQPVSSDIEYFCPMDPGVISNWPSKCGVCNMTLVQRRKGEAAMLPDGVIARMQLSPYRVQLAGILTTPVEFRALQREVRTTGQIQRENGKALCRVDIPSRRAPWIEAGHNVQALTRETTSRNRFPGHVASVERIAAGGWEALRCVVELDDPDGLLRPGMLVDLRLQKSLAELEPFRSQPAASPGRKPGELIEIFTCSDHPDTVAEKDGRCPRDGNRLMLHGLAGHEHIQWWCPMHPEVTAEVSGAVCRPCGGMVLRPRIVTLRPPEQVLAVPESAVVDTGARTLVFVENMPGMFDGVEVVLGPRCGDDFPVVRGLVAGQKIAITGAFLLDAETRLNPSLAATYFGAVRDQAKRTTAHALEPLVQGPKSAPTEEAKKIEAALSGLPEAERMLARKQRTCPVTNMPLGTMGTPKRIDAQGKVVFLCCDGCTEKFQGDVAKYLSALSGSGSP